MQRSTRNRSNSGDSLLITKWLNIIKFQFGKKNKPELRKVEINFFVGEGIKFVNQKISDPQFVKLFAEIEDQHVQREKFWLEQPEQASCFVFGVDAGHQMEISIGIIRIHFLGVSLLHSFY